MACKRNATTDLNHENWDQEDEPEEPGTFALASQEILEKRVVKTARRRLPASGEGAQKSAFKGFSGFKVSTAPTTSAFSFLKSNASPTSAPTQTSSIFSNIVPASNGATKTSENGMTMEWKPASISTSVNQKNQPEEPKKEMPKENTEKIFETSSEYFSKLKGLNESVTEWIKTHVGSNPFCILTPIFRDYERYLKEIESQYGQDESTASSSVSTEKVEETTKPPIIPSIKISPSSEPITKTAIFDNKTSSPSIFKSTNKSIFQGIPQSGESNPFLKLNTTESAKKPEDNKLENKSITFPQASGTATIPTFSFGTNPSASSSASFSFGSGKPFTFGNSVVSQESEASKGDGENKDEEDEPPKVEIKPVTEEGAVYEKRCKVFFKKDQGFSDRGVGVLFLKPTPTGKTQLIVRAETSLGNLLLNTLLTESVPTKRANKNTVMIMCLPLPDSKPPPTSVFLRVKTSEDADGLLEALENNKK